MNCGTGRRPDVLVVEDKPSLAELYAAWLSKQYEVTTAIGGVAALEAIRSDVDVVLLDRLMPEMSGDELLSLLNETGIDVQMAMVTAPDPSSDIIELAFDDYLCKPATRAKVSDLVERLLQRAKYDAEARRHFELARNLDLVEMHLSAEKLAASDAYAKLKSQFASLNAEPSAQLGDCSTDALRAVIVGR